MNDMSMLETLDVLNEELMQRGEEPVTFEHDCREGICGSCGFMINGMAHGPLPEDHGLPAHAAPFQRRRTNCIWSRGARQRFRCCAI